ncbi:hypothetical protein ACFE04_002004 [Oxalis oulophora]
MEDEEGIREGKSLSVTPTWAVATVISFMVAVGIFFHQALKKIAKWLEVTKRKSLLAALDKIKEEFMLFGVLSLLMGHWIVFIAKICIKSSLISSRFYPCSPKADATSSVEHIFRSNSDYRNYSVSRLLPERAITPNRYCHQGYESFASHESLEQMHRFVFVLAVTHISYSLAAIALAMIKIFSWKTWEIEAQAMAKQSMQGAPLEVSNSTKLRRLSTFIVHHVSHPWSQHGILVWLLCFSRQFWSSINQSDYTALRMGFISTHQLPVTYNFHNYMVRSMEEEFRDIVGIRIVVKLAVEIMERSPRLGHQHFNLRDELFWFGNPEFLLRLIQFISFQNAFEMASFLWSMWEINEPSCYHKNHFLGAIRLSFGIVSQIWCSFITFPLYVIVTQMGSRFKRSVISEDVRKSLTKWHKRVKTRQSISSSCSPFLRQSTLSSVLNVNKRDSLATSRKEEGSHVTLAELLVASKASSSNDHEISPADENSDNSFYRNFLEDYSSDDDDDNQRHSDKKSRK